jgi:hypothetical protein
VSRLSETVTPKQRLRGVMMLQHLPIETAAGLT